MPRERPHLITDREEIERLRNTKLPVVRYRAKDSKAYPTRVRPVCSEDGALVRKTYTMNAHGSDGPRQQHVGYWCPTCGRNYDRPREERLL